MLKLPMFVINQSAFPSTNDPTGLPRAVELRAYRSGPAFKRTSEKPRVESIESQLTTGLVILVTCFTV